MMNIKELRKAHNLSQAAMAAKLGITASVISKLENGTMKISDQIADRVWDVFGVEIIGEEEKKPAKKATAVSWPSIRKNICRNSLPPKCNTIKKRPPTGGLFSIVSIIST